MRTNLIASLVVSTALLLASASAVILLPSAIGNSNTASTTYIAWR